MERKLQEELTALEMRKESYLKEASYLDQQTIKLILARQ